MSAQSSQQIKLTEPPSSKKQDFVWVSTLLVPRWNIRYAPMSLAKPKVSKLRNKHEF